MAKKEQQPNLPGIPNALTTMWRVNYQFQGPNYALRAGSLIMPGEDIQAVRIQANGTLKDTYGDRWFNITSIKQLHEEPPF